VTSNGYLTRREAIPLIGLGALAAPTVLNACSNPSDTALGPQTIDLPGTIAYACDYLSGEWDVIVSDWDAETPRNVTRMFPGEHDHPSFGPSGELYFSSTEPTDTAGVVEQSINVIRDVDDPENSREKLVVEISGDSQYVFLNRPQVTPDASKILFSRGVYEAPEESGLFTMDINGGEPVALATGFSAAPGQLAFIPGTVTAIFSHNETEAPSSLKTVDLNTGVVSDYLFTAVTPGGASFNDSHFSTVAIDREGNAFGVANAPGSFFVFLYTWNFNDPSSVSRFGATTVSVQNTFSSYWWKDLKLIESVDGENDYLIMVYIRFQSDGKYSLGFSRTNTVAVSDWEPDYIKSIAGNSTSGTNRHPTWTPINLLGL